MGSPKTELLQDLDQVQTIVYKHGSFVSNEPNFGNFPEFLLNFLILKDKHK